MVNIFDIAVAKKLSGGGGGGGGSSNVITGEFTTSGAVGPETVSIPYNGEGYPIRACFYCDDNSAMTGTNRCVGMFAFYKSDKTTPPKYTAAPEDRGVVTSLYRYSTSIATRYTHVSSTTDVFSNYDVSATAVETLKFRSKNSISINVDDSSVGFPTNAKYRYFIEYSE